MRTITTLAIVGLILMFSSFALAGPRGDTVLAEQWKFIRQDVPGAQAADFDDAAWQAISVPHTWNAQDGQDGGNDYYRGPGWYRRHFAVTSAPGQRVFLRFEGASLAADVYVNGQSAGSHRGGFAAFCFDVTGLVHPGDNVLAVKVDNTLFPDIPPLAADFTFFGGIYRPVRVITTNAIHISLTDDASPGVYLKPVHVDDVSADVRATAVLANDSDAAETVHVRLTIHDAAGTAVATADADQAIAAHATVNSIANVAIPRPHLWNGRPDPYLYRASEEILRDGKILDRVDQPLGLRYYRVDAQEGFFLNGKHYGLHGVDRHQDHVDMGWATSDAQVDQDYAMIKEMGCTAVRLAHYQHPDHEYSVCDASGIAVWAELALVNKINGTPAFYDNAKQQLRELIKQNYNHPSILFWSLYNELGPQTRTNWDLVRQLNDEAHELDPDRLTVAATHLPQQVPVNWIMDITAINRYYGWYTGSMADWPTELDKIHAAYPNNAIGISEYGAGASAFQHEDRPTTQPIANKSHWHPEEWQAVVHEAAWKAMSQRKWIWGSFVWVMFDFASDSRDEGDHAGRNDKGLVTADRLIKKDAFYFYKANWSDEPFVYITSRRFDPRPAGRSMLKVYSNCTTVELFLNGKTLGKRTNADHIFVWPEVVLPAGECDMRAVGLQNGREYEDGCVWHAN